jgi:hypothetical protein
LAEETMTEEAKKHSDPILTKILPATTFHEAEEYVLVLYFYAYIFIFENYTEVLIESFSA